MASFNAIKCKSLTAVRSHSDINNPSEEAIPAAQASGAAPPLVPTASPDQERDKVTKQNGHNAGQTGMGVGSNEGRETQQAADQQLKSGTELQPKAKFTALALSDFSGALWLMRASCHNKSGWKTCIGYAASSLPPKSVDMKVEE